MSPKPKRKPKKVWSGTCAASDGYCPPLVADAHDSEVEFLASNGYFAGDMPQGIKPGDALLQTATRAFQELADIPQTGTFDRESYTVANRKRCALPDLDRGFVRVNDSWLEWSVESACTRRWSVKDLTCNHDNMSFRTLSAADTDAAWWKAFLSLDAVCGVNFKRVPWNGKRSANIYHEREAMDGRSGKLAYQYLANCNEPASSALVGRFDTGESWSSNMFQGVCCHEVIHGLGFHHSTDPKDLEYPYYRSSIITPQAGDIRRLQAVYGRNTSTPDEPDKPTEPDEPTPDTVNQRLLNLELAVSVNREMIKIFMEGK